MDKSKGFTLIEIIIVITILVLFSGLSIASYNNYTEQQKLETDTKKIVDVLELTRKKANTNDASLCAGDEFIDLTRVHGFTFSTPTSSSYKFVPNCGPQLTPTPIFYSTKILNNFWGDFTNTVTFSSGNIITFNTGADFCLILKNSVINSCRYIKVTNSGVISNGKSTNCSSCL